MSVITFMRLYSFLKFLPDNMGSSVNFMCKQHTRKCGPNAWSARLGMNNISFISFFISFMLLTDLSFL